MCVLNGIKPNSVAKKIGISSGIVTKWKMEGTLPNGEKLIKIASYLGCSVDYLLGLSIDKSSVSMYNRINFFEKLCKYNVTNKELSEAIGVSTGNISDWKSGKSKPNIDAITKIANYLDCSVDYLLGRTDNPISHKATAKIKNITVSSSGDVELQVTYSFKSGPVIEDDDETTTSK